MGIQGWVTQVGLDAVLTLILSSLDVIFRSSLLFVVIIIIVVIALLFLAICLATLRPHLVELVLHLHVLKLVFIGLQGQILHFGHIPAHLVHAHHLTLR